jgi:hypothetical protein
MALVLADRVKDSTTTTGTGTVTLSGTAATGFQNFSVIGNGNTTYYTIAGQGTTEWEVGIGTYASAGPTLARTTILSSSNGGSAVSFSSGTKDVFVTYPSSKSVNLDASSNANALGTVASAVLTNATGLPIATGVSGLGTGVATFLATPSSANLAAAVTNETGSGALVFATSPTLVTPVIGVATGTSLAVTAELTGAEVIASNGLIINNMTIGTSYTVSTGYGVMSVGPVTISGGVAVTLSGTARWVVL